MRWVCAAVLTMSLALPTAASAATTWTEADKDGYGTSTTTSSRVWHTLDDGRLTEVFYPDLGTPSVRSLEFVVSDNKGFSQRDTEARSHSIQLIESRSLTYRQVNEEPGRYRITKTYVTDPARNVLMIDVRFESLTGKKLQLDTLYDPSLGNDHQDDVAEPGGAALLARDTGSPVASAVAGSPAFARTSSTGSGGDLVQTAETSLTGLSGSQSLTVALGFGDTTAAALSAANASLGAGFGATRTAYESGWHSYLAGLKSAPASADATLYRASVMTLAAHEDKTYRGGYIASPTMPWVWGTGLESPSGAYHLVWARDLYQIATALIAAGDTAGANRAVDYLFFRQQKADGSFPQNSLVDGTPHWGNLQLDEVAFPIVLAWQLGRTDAALYRDHIKKAADFIVGFPNAPFSPQERWENQSGYSPGTIASEIAGLVCAADIARRNGDTASADRYLRTADDWQKRVDGWTATANGPYGPRPYYLRLTKDGKPNSGTTYNIGDSGPTVDQRKVVDPSFLELVRLGVKRADDPVVRNTIGVVDQQLASGDASGRYFWHRFNFDGYGEKQDGKPWDIGFPPNPTEVWANNVTIGRNWPIFGGERGEYELLMGNSAGARTRLQNMAAAANDGDMLPEQVWAPDFPPAGGPGFPLGEGTFSATPLAWSHAQYVRLAWSIDAGRPVERPGIVAARYGG
ncbi:MAG: glycoside hydrolase family 15 protein [Thermoleophilaceae bacterium]